MANEMIERAAKAIWDFKSDNTGDVILYYQEMAKAVIEVLREPTEPMLEAARDWSLAKYGKPVGNDGATGCWQAMLEAALCDE